MLWVVLILNCSLIFASYEPVPLDDEHTRTDVALVELAYSHSAFDNVGMLKGYIKERLTGYIFDPKCHATAIYIGEKFGKGFCLTCAHCRPHDFSPSSESTTYYDVVFEINGQKKNHYKVADFIPHPQRAQNPCYDLAVLILEKPVTELKGLKISEDFSRSQTFLDYQHLLTYVGYGVRISDNNYFLMIDEKRRAINAYTEECSTRPQDLGIYSTPYGQYNKSKTSRPLIAYEVASRDRMSGGGAINTKHELVGIIRGTQFPEQLSWKQHLYPATYNLTIEHVFETAPQCYHQLYV